MSLWTPRRLEQSLWLDFADEDSLTVVDDKISQVLDKSGDERHATEPVLARRPDYSVSGLNGLSVATSPGSSTLGGPGFDVAQASWGSSVSICSLVQTFADASMSTVSAGVFDCATSVNFGGSFGIRHDMISNSYRFGVSAGGVSDFGVVDRVGRTSWVLFISVYDETAGRTIFVDGVPVFSDSKTGAIRYDGVGDTQIMRLTNRTRALWGGLAELSVISSVLAESDRQKMEGYLLHKWGLSANLPDGHPYKDSPPKAGSTRRRRMMMMQRGGL